MTVQPTPRSGRERARSTPPRPLTLQEVAQQCLDNANDTDNVVQEATTAMVAVVSNNDVLFRALFTPEQVRQNCYTIVRALVRSQRDELWSTPQPSDEAARAALDSHAGITMRRLMDFRLWNGKPLGEATKAEVLAAAQRWIKQGSSMIGTGRWLELVGNACPDTGVVRDRLNEQDLLRFRAQIDNPTPPRGRRGRRRS